MICTSCGKECGEGIKFCYHCGSDKVEMPDMTHDSTPQVKFCQSCGKQNEGDAVYCMYCGWNYFGNSATNVSTPASIMSGDSWIQNAQTNQHVPLGYRNNNQIGQMYAPGSKMINISSILYIIFGGLNSLLGFISLITYSETGRQAARIIGVDQEIYLFTLLLQTGNYVMALIIGIFGVRNAAKLEKSNFCFNFGVAVAIVQATTFIGTLSLVGFQIFDTITLALPVFFLMGVNKNKKAYINR